MAESGLNPKYPRSNTLTLTCPGRLTCGWPEVRWSGLVVAYASPRQLARSWLICHTSPFPPGKGERVIWTCQPIPGTKAYVLLFTARAWGVAIKISWSVWASWRLEAAILRSGSVLRGLVRMGLDKGPECPIGFSAFQKGRIREEGTFVFCFFKILNPRMWFIFFYPKSKNITEFFLS